jgi:hypothetical protein
MMVDPCCIRTGGVHGFAVVSPSGSIGGSPAFPQLMARLEERIPDHGPLPPPPDCVVTLALALDAETVPTPFTAWTAYV